MARRLIFANIIGVIIVFLLVAACAYFYYEHEHYVKTDDAIVSADMMPVIALKSGVLSAWSGSIGEDVTNGDNIGNIFDGKKLTPVSARMDGKIIKNEARKNQMVQAGQVLAQEADMDHLYIIANIKETDLKDIEKGDSVDVTVDGDSDTVFDGTVEEIGYATNSIFSVLPSSSSGNYTKVTQKVPVKISVEHPSSKVLPGMNAEVKIRK
ncbi:HlyD family efflux transporter periplasmic adaptor subunit [Bacillus sp. FJAT-49736]|uniref:HlyD family secretion protein n=1 Tax=Bacillus sp. FJAT-49736 TaxID=2833582 RepID=UPI001BC9F8ED|nr:HlyD family efflux transporter periplasmic adaptor subunit [Bacillus sp. FJAT-49736]MBS4175567.1 HlyD family secretion protein [Bacillus sp. FJAT-49736]